MDGKKKIGRKFKTTLVKGGGDSFCEALRNTGNDIDVGVDQVMFTVGESGINVDSEDDGLRKSIDANA